MSIKRIHRLLQLIMLLQNEKALHTSDLTTQLGISRRTLFRDLHALAEAGIPYYHEPGAGYRIARSFFLPPIDLTVLETLALMLLGEAATTQAVRPMAAPALSALNKLLATVPQPVRAACGELMAPVSVQLAPQTIADREEALYAQLQRCIDEGRVCKMAYDSRMDDEAATLRCRFEPYALHFATRAWYVIGQSDIHAQVRTFKLARIAKLEALSQRFERPAQFSVSNYLGQAWQMIPEGKVHQIELDFDAKVAVNVAEVKWHASQKQRMLADGKCRMRFAVDGLGEIAWWLCGYADQVTIRKPIDLRHRVRDMLAAAVRRHERP
jgi:predicted DNA-binding transcriptional regulator YafY